MRIVAGKWGGRTLRAPRGTAVRPTTDRVREALFSILGARVEGAAVLDLFGGTGALALEALSRGASSAFVSEPDADAFAAIAANAASVGAAGLETFRADFRKAVRRLSQEGRRFDLVFLDPPYGKGLAASAASALSGAGLLAPGALVVVEEGSKGPLSDFPGDWAIMKDRRYGDTRVTIFEVADTPSNDGPAPGTEQAPR
jgi:16S rRNA (guanine966-N2)-methyltransferase